MATHSIKAVNKVRTKSEIYTGLMEVAGITRKQVAAVFDGLTGMIKKDLGKGPGIFAVPGLMKITVVRKPATPAATRPDPFHPGQHLGSPKINEGLVVRESLARRRCPPACERASPSGHLCLVASTAGKGPLRPHCLASSHARARTG
jgi:hypothetical protein